MFRLFFLVYFDFAHLTNYSIHLLDLFAKIYEMILVKVVAILHTDNQQVVPLVSKWKKIIY